jgi:dihydroorotase-like cyclic amidohydrolase
MERIAQVGGIALVHAEEGHTISWLERRGRETLGSAATMADYIASRPERLEAVAVDLAGLWASVTSCPLYIVHLSTAAGVETVRTLRRRGLDITVETCPHYLTLDQEQLVRIGPLGKFAPVLRSSEHQTALWEAVTDGSISTIGSDHAAHAGSAKQELGCQHGIFETPFGIPGIETLFPLLYTFGVGTGRLTRERLSALISANVARRFGWFPQKGVLQVGSEADLILIDPSEERPVRAANLRSRAGYSPYEGTTLKGWPSLTLVRGKVVFDGKTVQAEGGRFRPTEPTAMKLRGGR